MPDDGGSDIKEMQVQINVEGVWADAPCEQKEMTRCVIVMNKLAKDWQMNAGEEIIARVRASNAISWGPWSDTSINNA